MLPILSRAKLHTFRTGNYRIICLAVRTEKQFSLHIRTASLLDAARGACRNRIDCYDFVDLGLHSFVRTLVRSVGRSFFARPMLAVGAC